VTKISAGGRIVALKDCAAKAEQANKPVKKIGKRPPGTSTTSTLPQRQVAKAKDEVDIFKGPGDEFGAYQCGQLNCFMNTDETAPVLDFKDNWYQVQTNKVPGRLWLGRCGPRRCHYPPVRQAESTCKRDQRCRGAMRALLNLHAGSTALAGLRRFTLPLITASTLVGALITTLVTLAGVGGATAEDAGVQVFRAMVGARVVMIAPGFVGQTVGGGECTDFVDTVLALAVAQPGNNYVWGTPTDQIQAGDIIQFWKTQFTGPNGAAWGTTDKHTAIVLGVNGTRVTLIHQNFPERMVTKGDYDLGWPHTGTYNIYQPISK
jgi:CHAP domain-containing protein